MLLSQLLTLPAGVPDREITAITCDSRRIVPGCAFVCIEGTARDGHDFAPAAVEGGAAAVITRRPLGLPGEVTVPDTRLEWAGMCRRWFGDPARRLRMIGVTGTNGKTTVTWLIKSALERCGYKVGLMGTIQNMIGEEILPSGHTTPDPYELQQTLARMVEAGCEFGVMEVSSHALCQDRVAGIRFEAGIFTNLTQDHLDYHGTMENYMQAKKRLFYQTDLAVMNRDDPRTPAMAAGIPCPLITFGAMGEGDYTASDPVFRPDGVEFTLGWPDGEKRIRFGIPGRFSVYNALAAAACLMGVGIPPLRAAEALEQAKGVRGRAEILPVGQPYTVVIDYAHTPDGLQNICQTLKECCPGRLITLFGCGGDRDRTKRPQMGRIAAALSDLVVVTSDNPRSESPGAIIREILAGMEGTDTPYEVVENRPAAIRRALELARPGDTVLLAGKGHETYQILAEGTIHLDEREVVAEALKEQEEK